jgi:hypothetical protein
MVLATRLSQSSVLGFFELDDAGVIRYCSPTSFPSDDYTPVGQNFFEIADINNRDELRRLFLRFVDSRDAADSFGFDCLFDGSIVHTKVTLTRAFQTEHFPPEAIVMLSIREGSR